MTCWACGYSSPSSACENCAQPFRSLAEANSIAPLLDLARTWGIPDDGYCSDVVAAADPTAVQNLLDAVGPAPQSLWDWLVDEAATAESSNEYVALTCLTMAFDEALVRKPPVPD